MAAKKKPGVVKVSGGKEYKMVVARIEDFRTNEITKIGELTLRSFFIHQMNPASSKLPFMMKVVGSEGQV